MNLVSTSLEFFKSEGKVREYCFLNQQPIELISADEAKKTFKKINVFSKKLADNLDWTNRLDYQNSEIDTTFFFKGKLLKTHQDILGTSGAYHNHQYSAALIELHESSSSKVTGYVLLLLEYAVPSKHINNIDEYYLPKPFVECFHFSTKDELNLGLDSIALRSEYLSLKNNLFC